jgi:type II secretory pathway pseudopilin PulG
MFITQTKRNLRQRGDTIVEVLLCIAIVGAVIAGAYALASNSLQEGISASAHTQAIKRAEAQIEALKYRQIVSSSHAADWAKFTTDVVGKHFCLNASGTNPADAATWFPIINQGSPANLKVGATNYAAGCAVDDNRFFVDITTASTPSTRLTYLVVVRWETPGGGPLSQTQLYYRF